mgnify:CR=1 FL=1
MRLVASLLVCAFALPLQAEEKVLNLYNWADYVPQQALQRFQAETGIRVKYDSFDSTEVLESKLLTGGSGYDLVFPSSSVLGRAISAKALQPVGELANGDICLAVGFSGDIMQAASRAAEAGNGVKIEYVIPKEGAPMWFDMVTMPADAPNEAAGYAFMNHLLQPEVMAGISNHVHYANGNAKADALVDPALKSDNKVYPPQEVMTKLYALEAMPLKVDRVRTRIWSKVKSGT